MIKFIMIALSFFISQQALAENCDVMPIGINQASLDTLGVGESTIIDKKVAKSAVNFSWLTWTGKNAPSYIQESLIFPGNVDTYETSPLTDNSPLSIGSWVEASPGAKNSKKLNQAVSDLQGKSIVLPVWDEFVGNGGNRDFHVSNFAVVTIEDFNLSGNGYLNLTFEGYISCPIINN